MSGIGLALSGGGFRAAAFHLGALRALHRHDLLPRVRVLSAVSGGALMAALWAYHPGSFAEFDRDATSMLRRGLHYDIARRALRLDIAARSLAGAAISLARPGQPRPARWLTRTDALAAVLRHRAFGHTLLGQPAVDTDIVLTATDLITGSAMRSALRGRAPHGSGAWSRTGKWPTPSPRRRRSPPCCRRSNEP